MIGEKRLFKGSPCAHLKYIKKKKKKNPQSTLNFCFKKKKKIISKNQKKKIQNFVRTTFGPDLL